MATQLSFTKNEKNQWEGSFVSSGNPCAIEVNRENPGTLIIYGNIEGMEKVILHNFGPGADCNILAEIDVPSDVVITVVSFVEVTDAQIVGL